MPNLERMPDWAFRIMSLMHDNPFLWLFRNPYNLLKTAGLNPGQKVLEIGCGPGFFTIPAAKIVGEEGIVYALDVHPLAIKKVQEKIREGRVRNVKTILASATETGLPDKSIDIAILFGFIHHTENLDNILSELYRVLKPVGVLSIEKTPWVSEKKLVEEMERNGFIYTHHRGRVFLFIKRKNIEKELRVMNALRT